MENSINIMILSVVLNAPAEIDFIIIIKLNEFAFDCVYYYLIFYYM